MVPEIGQVTDAVASSPTAPLSGVHSETNALKLYVGEPPATGFTVIETAVPIAAGTNIGVAFWQGGGGAAGIDNVSIIPEPSTGSMMALGLAGLVTTRLLRRKNS